MIASTWRTSTPHERAQLFGGMAIGIVSLIAVLFGHDPLDYIGSDNVLVEIVFLALAIYFWIGIAFVLVPVILVYFGGSGLMYVLDARLGVESITEALWMVFVLWLMWTVVTEGIRQVKERLTA